MEWYVNVAISIFTLAGGVAGYKAVKTYLMFRSGNYTISKARRTDILDEHREFIQTLQKENAAQRVEMEKKEEMYRRELERRSAVYKEEIDRRIALEAQLAKDHAECEARYARAEERITALEDALSGAGIKHRPWKRPHTGGTDLHTPLPPD